MIRSLLATLCVGLASLALAQDQRIERAPLHFGATVDGSCSPDDALTKEAATLGVIAAEIAAKTLLSVVQGALDEAAKDKSVTKIGTAAGALYVQNKDGKLEPKSDARCINFWYGKRGSYFAQSDADAALQALVQSSSINWSNKEKSLLRRWVDFNFVEVPFVYGQIVVSASADGSAILLQPRWYFARPTPDLKSSWGPSPLYTITVELNDVGQDKPFAIHAVGLQSPIEGPLLMSQENMTGMQSGWFPGPKIDAPPKDKPVTTGRFSVKVMLTSTQPGSKLAKAFGGALSASNEAIVKALTPKLSSETTSAKQVAVEAAFDADAAVAEAQRAFEAADAADKPILQIKLQKAKFVANARRIAAGLPPKYDVQP